MNQEFDVLIVGAGPAGCTAAERLAGGGWSVAVLEEHDQVGDPVNCSGIISVEAVESFRLPKELIRHTLNSVKFQSPGGQWLNFDAGRPLAHAVDRTDLDRVLAGRAERAGAEIYLGHRVLDVNPGAKSVSVRIRRDGNEPVSLRARSVILATGAGVPLLQDLGWGGSDQRLLGVQTELELDAVNVEVYLGKKLAPEGFAWIVPLGDGLVKAGLLCPQDGPRYLRSFLDRPDIRSRLLGEIGPIQCSVLPLGFLRRTYRDRILVVGEAAGHIKTTTCGGIYYGMLTAGMAAEVLDGALMNDSLGAEHLSCYEKMWRELLQGEIETGLRLRRAFHLLNDFTLDKLVSLACRNGILELVHEKADFDWHQDLIRAVFRHAAVSRILGLAWAC